MKVLAFRELDQSEPFDPLILNSKTPFTQAQFYGQWQTNLGREVKRFVVLSEGKKVAYFQLIKYPLFGQKSYFYIPYGPIIKDFSESLLKFIQTKLYTIARENNAIFVRLDFTPRAEDTEAKKLLARLFTKSLLPTYHSVYFQPRLEWFLDLRKTEDQLLKEMHKGTRYSIHLARRKGITTEIVTSDFEKYFEDFYELISGTAKRNRFNLHQKNYYQNIFNNLRSDNAYLTIARSGEKILVIKLIICYGSIASCIFSGSSNDQRDLRPTYLVQWAAIAQAKKLGHNFYNFGGISSGKIYPDWSGLTSFKKNFGGLEVRHSDFFDIIVQPLWYELYNFRKFIKNYL
ncbi:MAG TPA: peptidoglycan bridge formation glycyltransferase FemA/FemB family protein [Candidatus Paceibacterota bacterium]